MSASKVSEENDISLKGSRDITGYPFVSIRLGLSETGLKVSVDFEISISERLSELNNMALRVSVSCEVCLKVDVPLKYQGCQHLCGCCRISVDIAREFMGHPSEGCFMGLDGVGNRALGVTVDVRGCLPQNCRQGSHSQFGYRGKGQLEHTQRLRRKVRSPADKVPKQKHRWQHMLAKNMAEIATTYMDACYE
jgi:hypothetical protein